MFHSRAGDTGELGKPAGRSGRRWKASGSSGRLVMSSTPFSVTHYLLTHPQIGVAKKLNNPPHLSKNAHPLFRADL